MTKKTSRQYRSIHPYIQTWKHPQMNWSANMSYFNPNKQSTCLSVAISKIYEHYIKYKGQLSLDLKQITYTVFKKEISCDEY